MGRRRAQRGLALATVLFVVVLVLMFALTLAGLASSRYQMASQGLARQLNFEAAQAGLAETIARMTADPRFGRSGETVSRQLSPGGPRYQVTFDRSAGVPWSVNNLQGTTRTAGWQGRVVPPYSALLISRASVPGEEPGRTRTLEALVQFRSFPYAIAGTGVVRTGDLLQVLGGASLSDLLAGRLESPGHAYSGSVEMGSLRTGALSRISGKARSPGSVLLGPGSTAVQGIENGIEPDSLPDVNLDRYDNRTWTETVELAPGTYLAPLPLSGPIYVPGDLDLRLGAVLANAHLFVNGRMSSGGPLTGTGSVFVRGRLDLTAAANLVLTNGIAVFAGDDLEIRGPLAGVQVFQGVLYSHGNLRIRDMVQVVGSVVAQSTSPTKGNVILDRQATVIHLPEYTQFGSYWELLGMKGSALQGELPLLKVKHWSEIP